MIQYKIIAALVGTVLAFSSGWKVNDWRNDAQQRKAEQEYQTALDNQRAELFAEWEIQHNKDELERISLATDLDNLRAQNSNLQEDLANATLVQPEIEVRWRERVVAGECTAEALADFNPFGIDFVRLWNDAANSGSVLPGGPPEDQASRGDATFPTDNDGAVRRYDGATARGSTESVIASPPERRPTLQRAQT